MPSHSEEDRLKSPLAKARGLGSAHHGAEHWLHQKITALANIPLILWLVWSIVKLKAATYAQFTAWLASPLNAILMILLIISVLYHARLGSQVIAEDYLSGWFRMSKLIGIRLFFFAIGVACIFSVLKIAFTAGM
ncbi:MAG: succinate dehydrogenase, hydrophobic membrane anchor protein [Alphaproteobacteria bacterium]|nr:succinate dehydrogenase, hydrophobic membrane anchor protein [Alphaproteobacteria bacterium]MCB9974340.1 succinate dehydrogenase, hydrophobic membrane anchor protein [Rhodospirillales bacterium]